MEDYDEQIIALLGKLRHHRGNETYSDFIRLFGLLYERGKEGCLCDEEAQIYRQQGAALAMRDLLISLEGS